MDFSLPVAMLSQISNGAISQGSEVLVHHGGQPMTMFKYACHKAEIDIKKSKLLMQVMATKWMPLFVKE